MNKLKRMDAGQMLIEVVVAVGIISLVLIGISDLMVRSLRVATYQKQRDEATEILQKVQNDYKAERDSDPEGFYLSVANAVIDPCVAGKPYTCTIVIEKAADSVTITATAEWDDGGVQLSTLSTQSLARSTK